MNTPIKEHPTVAAHRRKLAPENISTPLDAGWLRQLCLDAGADDVGFVEVDCQALAAERPHIQRAFPHVRSLISIVLRMNRDNVRWLMDHQQEAGVFSTVTELVDQLSDNPAAKIAAQEIAARVKSATGVASAG